MVQIGGKMNKKASLLPTTSSRMQYGSRKMAFFSKKNTASKNGCCRSAAVVTMLVLISLGFRSSYRQTTVRKADVVVSSVVDYDMVVIGSGPAGMTAALYGARAGWSVLVLGNLADSQLARAQVLDNIPGYSKKNGLQWLQETLTQLQEQKYRTPIHFASTGIQVERVMMMENGVWGVTTNTGMSGVSTTTPTIRARAVILASGSVPRRLELPGESTLWGRHVHSCAVCDGSVYGANDTVVVVGGGDAALESVLLLQRSVKHVLLIHRRETFRAQNKNNLQQVVSDTHANVQVYTPFVVVEYVVEHGSLVGIHIQDTTKSGASAAKKYIPCSGVFLLLGATPNTQLLASGVLSLEADGYVLPQKQHTGIFVAGDVADRVYRQAITAAASGAQAALDAEAWLRERNYTPTTPNSSTPVIPLQPRTRKISSTHTTPATKEAKGESSSCDLHSKECLQSILSKHPVVVFSKPWCPYCRKALQAFAAEHVQPHVVDLVMKDASVIQSVLATLSGGRRTVPNVFIGGRSVGGGDETVALHNSGKLKQLLQEAGADVLKLEV